MPKRQPTPWYRKSRGEWFVTLEGKQVPLGVKDPRARAAAYAALEAYFQGEDAGPNAGQLIADLVPAYLDSVSHRVEPQTVVKYRGDLAWLLAQFPTAPVDVLVPVEIEKAAARESWSDSHRANVLYTVQSFVRWAGRHSFKLVRPPKDSRGSESVIPPEVYERILRETTGDFHQLCRALWFTGTRPSEMFTLTVEAVDWANSSATLKRHKTKKKGKTRVVHFSPEAMKVLTEQRDRYGSGALFRGVRGERLTIRAVVGRFLRLSEKVGHPVTSYCFRHSYATRALSAGLPDTHVAALLGHTSTTMLHKNYSHIGENAKVLREAAARLDAA